jgi:putative spermidine/putrescine transport system substrate-binding protein
MADGVPPERVYEVLRSPGGIERAIRKVEQLKPHVAVWWTSGAQHAQLMKDGEVDMITGWNGRFDVIAKDGAQVAYTFNQALLDYDCLAIPRGAPNRTQAMRFLAEMAKAQYQAEFTKFITYGPTNRRGYDFIEPALARQLPSYPANAALQLPIDLAWYIQFEAQAASAYENMITR